MGNARSSRRAGQSGNSFSNPPPSVRTHQQQQSVARQPTPGPTQTQTRVQAPSNGPVRCPRCRRLLQPPAGHPRFLCPCGQMLMSPSAVQTPQRVRCPYCQTLLAPPPGAPIFRCPCGNHLRVPNQSAVSVNNGAGGAGDQSKNGQNDAAIQAVAKLLNRRGSRRWMKETGADGKLHWVRLPSEQEEAKVIEMELDLIDNLEAKVKECGAKDLKKKIKAMGLDPNKATEKRDLEKIILGAKSALKSKSSSEIKRRLDKLQADYSNCIEKSELVNRLIVAAWFGKGKFADGSWVRDFKSDGQLTWVQASEYALDLSNGIVKSSDLEGISGKPFMEKLRWFKERTNALRVKWEDGHVRIRVRRSHLLVDSFNSLTKLESKDMKRYFRFEFIGEPGVDAGGVAREWFQLVTDSCFNVDFGLFEYSGVDNICYQINPSSGIANELHLRYFHFLGRVLGKALFDGHVISGHLAQPLYKHILAWPIALRDLEFVDAQMHKSLRDILECDDVSYLYLDFTTAVRVFGETQVIDLKPGGSDIEVTNKNRKEYVDLMVKHIMLDRISPQLSAFLSGFYQVIPQGLLSAFDFQELELLLCGLPNVDVEDWRRHTKYRGEYAQPKESHKVIQWFWEVLKESTEEQKARLLQFATGTSRVPVQGFGALQGNDGNIKLFTIDSVPFETSVFPKAHTCFNRIELPLYPSKTDLRKFLLQAIQMEIVGFGIE